MRLIEILLLLVVFALAGWIAGSLHPAPAAIISPIEKMLAQVTLPEEAPADDAETVDTVADEEADAEIEAPALTPIPAPTPARTPISEEDRDAQYRAWISEARAAHPYPESEDKMYAVMMCESGGNAEIVNPAGPYTGLFQYVAGTWNGDWNDYRDASIKDARAQIFATALAWNLGMQSHWGCYNRSH